MVRRPRTIHGWSGCDSGVRFSSSCSKSLYLGTRWTTVIMRLWQFSILHRGSSSLCRNTASTFERSARMIPTNVADSVKFEVYAV